MDTEYLKRVGLYILSALLSIGLVFYLGYHLWRTFTREIETTPAVKISAKKTVAADGYMFRYETPVFSTGSGTSYVPSVEEGEKVRTGGEIVRVYSASSPELCEKIADINDQIKLLEECVAGDGTITLKGSTSIDSEIYDVLSQIRERGGNGAAGDAVSLRSALLTGINKRSILTGTKGDFKGEIAALEAEKAELTARLGSLLETVNTPVSGYYYQKCDGYEGIFDAALLEDISYTELVELLKKAPVAALENSCVGKSVTKADWYVCVSLEKKYSATYKEGDTVAVSFKAQALEMEMEIDAVLSDSQNIILVLHSDIMPKDFEYTRVQNVELAVAQYDGLKVPISAVRVIDGKTGVYILDDSVVTFASFEPLYQSDGSVIAAIDEAAEEEAEEDEETTAADAEAEKTEEYERRLRLHDTIITKGKGLYEGRVIGN